MRRLCRGLFRKQTFLLAWVRTRPPECGFRTVDAPVRLRGGLAFATAPSLVLLPRAGSTRNLFQRNKTAQFVAENRLRGLSSDTRPKRTRRRPFEIPQDPCARKHHW